MSTILFILSAAVILLLFVGFYCLLVTRNLIRTLIALEVLTKAVTLLIIVVGYISGQMALAQSFVITLIVIEVVIIAIAAAIVVGLHRHNNTLDMRNERNDN
jgi:NADH-quinone oxidoreductase subunit K